MEKKSNYKLNTILQAIAVICYVLCYKRDGNIIWLLATITSSFVLGVMVYNGIKGKNN